jgi:hypothetical protein
MHVVEPMFRSYQLIKTYRGLTALHFTLISGVARILKWGGGYRVKFVNNISIHFSCKIDTATVLWCSVSLETIARSARVDGAQRCRLGGLGGFFSQAPLQWWGVSVQRTSQCTKQCSLLRFRQFELRLLIIVASEAATGLYRPLLNQLERVLHIWTSALHPTYIVPTQVSLYILFSFFTLFQHNYYWCKRSCNRPLVM